MWDLYYTRYILQPNNELYGHFMWKITSRMMFYNHPHLRVIFLHNCSLLIKANNLEFAPMECGVSYINFLFKIISWNCCEIFHEVLKQNR